MIRSMLRFYWVSLTAVIMLLTNGVIVNTKPLWLTLLHLEILVLLLKPVPLWSSTVLSEKKMFTRNKLVGWNNSQNDTSQVRGKFTSDLVDPQDGNCNLDLNGNQDYIINTKCWKVYRITCR